METSLYLPVKRHLESLGFTVKGEVGGCDLVALSGDDPPIVVIGELKLSFNLELILQGVERAGACDEVWLAARLSMNGKGRESDARYRNLCRRLGFGMLGVTDQGSVEVLVAPSAVSPRRNPKKRSRLVIGAPTPQGRSSCRRQHTDADHDSVSPAGTGLRSRNGHRSMPRAGSQSWKLRTPEKSFSITSMDGSTASSVEFMP